MAQEDEFEAKAEAIVAHHRRWKGGVEDSISDALRAEHTRGQIEALGFALYAATRDEIHARIAELRKGA